MLLGRGNSLLHFPNQFPLPCRPCIRTQIWEHYTNASLVTLPKLVSSTLPPVYTYSNVGTLHDRLFSYTSQISTLCPWCTLFGPTMLATTLRRLLGIMASPIFAMRMKMMASSGWMFVVNMMSTRVTDSRHGLMKHFDGRALGWQTHQRKIF